MKYDIHKDEKPEETVKKIKNILEEIGIETTETFFETDYIEKTSVKVEIKDTNKKTYGKGICKINALASGYGEFMERLQSQLLFEFSKENDAIYYEIEEIKNNQYIKNELLQDIDWEKFYQAVQYDLNLRKKAIKPNFSQSKFKKKKISFIPFKSIKNKEKIYIPENILHWFQVTNGFASGNTYEEAFVQALSEICERYEQRKIIKNQIRMPDVPYEYYSKYDNVMNLIHYIENSGYKIKIKDASCGELPVVMTIIAKENEKNNKFCISTGSHPCLSVAIERTLTEFLQGFNLKKDILPVISKDYQDIDIIIEALYNTNIDIEKSEFFEFLYNTKSDYNFNKGIWGFSENITNKEMAKTLAQRVLNIADDIYIRNYNFLNFPAISIYIPQISTIYTSKYKERVIERKYYLSNILKNLVFKRYKNITLEDIYYTCETNALYNLNTPVGIIFGNEMYLFLVMSAILLKDEYKIKRALYLTLHNFELINNQSKNKTLKYQFKALEKYFNLQFDNKTENEIKDIIIQEYSQEMLYKIQVFISDINLMKMVNFIRKKFEEYELSINNEERNKTKCILSKIAKRLSGKYTENLPEQKHFIDFLYE